MAEFKTDALNPSARPSTTFLGQRGSSSKTPQNIADTLNKTHEAWNQRIDKDMSVLSTGLVELVELSAIPKTPTPLTSETQSLHLKLKTANLIRAAQDLRDTAHELKLMLLLSDEVELARRRDREMGLIRGEVMRGRREVVREVLGLFGGSVSPSGGMDLGVMGEVEVGNVDRVRKEEGAGEGEGGDAGMLQGDDGDNQNGDDVEFKAGNDGGNNEGGVGEIKEENDGAEDEGNDEESGQEQGAIEEAVEQRAQKREAEEEAKMDVNADHLVVHPKRPRSADEDEEAGMKRVDT